MMVKAGNDLAKLLAATLAALAVYTAGFGVFDNAMYSGLTVALGIVAALLGGARSRGALAFHFLLSGIFLALSWVWLGIMLEQEEFFLDITSRQFMMSWAAFAVIGYVTWRGFGWPMLAVFIFFGLYAIAPFGANEHWTRVAENLWYSTDGVYGRPVEVVGRIVLVFIVFGSVLQVSGAGAVLLKMAFVATGRFTGGPAHASIVGSAMFGTLSGAAIANVVSTGVFTIPVIKKAGFNSKFAGAVEAAASTGGQIMPPVMGVVAFLMADVTGIPYLQIIVAALIPAIFYYMSLFMAVLVEARRLGIKPAPREELESLTRDDWLKSLAFFGPLAVIIGVLVTGRTAQMAGFCALATAAGLCLALFPGFRSPKAWIKALVEAGRASATIMTIVAAIGFVIGVINMSGIGLEFAQGIQSVSGASLFLSLVLVMIGCLVMGMGVPSAPAYLILAIVMGPALSKLGVPVIAAHMFMLYFGVLSVVTPPVALAAFAAAPIAGSKPMETGMEAVRLSVAGFIIPFMFIYHPDLLLIEGFTAAGLAWGIGAFILATWLIVTALGGHDAARVGKFGSVLRLACAIAILFPDPLVSGGGACAGLACAAAHNLIASRRRKLKELNA